MLAMNFFYFHLPTSIVTSPSGKNSLDIFNSRLSVIFFHHFKNVLCPLDSITSHKHLAVGLTMTLSEVIDLFSSRFKIFTFYFVL